MAADRRRHPEGLELDKHQIAVLLDSKRRRGKWQCSFGNPRAAGNSVRHTFGRRGVAQHHQVEPTTAGDEGRDRGAEIRFALRAELPGVEIRHHRHARIRAGSGIDLLLFHWKACDA